MADEGELIERFYRAFAAHDAETMAASYAPEAHFSDPVFPDLNGTEPGDMWRMLLAGGGDLRVELLAHDASDGAGTARWRAHYTFSETGRTVVNDVAASFVFRDGLIAEHRDRFDFHRWARQALGTPGLLLGWTPLLRAAVRRRAARRLGAFRSS